MRCHARSEIRSEQIQRRYGAEYDRTIGRTGDVRKAAEEYRRFSMEWQEVQHRRHDGGARLSNRRLRTTRRRHLSRPPERLSRLRFVRLDWSAQGFEQTNPEQRVIPVLHVCNQREIGVAIDTVADAPAF